MVVTRSESSSQVAPASGAPSSDTPPSDNQLQGGVTAQPEVLQVIDSQTDGIDSEVGQQQQKGESLNLLFGMSLKGWK